MRFTERACAGGCGGQAFWGAWCVSCAQQRTVDLEVLPRWDDPWDDEPGTAA